MSWLIDNARFVYVILGIIALALGVSWWLNRRARTLLIALGVVGLMVLFWLLTLFVPTDRKRIESSLWAMARAVLDRKPGDLVQHWSQDFTFQGLKRDELAQLTAKAAGRFSVESINLWEFDVKHLDESKAEIWFRCVANSQQGGTFLALCRAHFVKEGEHWKLQRIGFYQPIANTDQEISLPIR